MLGKGDQGDGKHGPESLQLKREDGFIPRSTRGEVLGAPRTQGQKEPLVLCGQRQLPETALKGRQELIGLGWPRGQEQRLRGAQEEPLRGQQKPV